MRHKWVNTLLFAFLGAAICTGFLGFASGSPARSFVLKAHVAAAFSILAVSGWKVALATTSLKRPLRGRPRSAALVFAGLVVMAIASGSWWSTGGYWQAAGISGMTWHAIAGAALIPLFAWHAWAYTSRLRVGYEADRRAALRFLGVAAAAVAAWAVTEKAVRVAGLSSGQRRFTGSYERRSYSGNSFPSTSWLNDNPPPLDLDAWGLEINGLVGKPARHSFHELARAGSGFERVNMVATLDCTGGWYSEQEWSGVRLRVLLGPALPKEGARSIEVRSITGYWRRFPVESADDLLIATHVGGQLLTHQHGAPVRLVAPGRRGFDWVKWVTQITVEAQPAWLQPPFPLS